MNRNLLIGIVAVLAVAGLVFALSRKTAPVSPAALAPSFTAPATATPAPVPTPQPPQPAAEVVIDPAQIKPMPGRALDVATVALEAKMIANAQDLLAAGKPREALKQIDDYEHVPDRAALVPEAKFVKIEALARVGGRRTDALALAMVSRTDPTMEPYRERIEEVLVDAGATSPTFASP